MGEKPLAAKSNGDAYTDSEPFNEIPGQAGSRNRFQFFDNYHGAISLKM
jgi:hypothetical protein